MDDKSDSVKGELNKGSGQWAVENPLPIHYCLLPFQLKIAQLRA